MHPCRAEEASELKKLQPVKTKSFDGSPANGCQTNQTRKTIVSGKVFMSKVSSGVKQADACPAHRIDRFDIWHVQLPDGFEQVSCRYVGFEL